MKPNGAQMEPSGVQQEPKGSSNGAANPYEVPSKINCAIPLIAQRLHVHFDTVFEQKKAPKSALIPDKRVLSISRSNERFSLIVRSTRGKQCFLSWGNVDVGYNQRHANIKDTCS